MPFRLRLLCLATLPFLFSSAHAPAARIFDVSAVSHCDVARY